MERSLEVRTPFSGKLLRLEVHRVRLPGGGEAVREVVRHPGAVVVVPRLGDGRFVLVRQYRFAVGEELYEFPAGTREAGEDPERCAARELVEETGLSGKLVFLGRFYSAPGFCDEALCCFLAEVAAAGSPRPEADEQLEIVVWGEEELRRAVREGVVRDAKTLAALALLAARGVLSGSA